MKRKYTVTVTDAEGNIKEVSHLTAMNGQELFVKLYPYAKTIMECDSLEETKIIDVDGYVIDVDPYVYEPDVFLRFILTSIDNPKDRLSLTPFGIEESTE